MTMFSDLGVNVVDAEEVEEAAAAEPLDDEEEDRQASPSHLPVKQERSTEVSERTDDPVRMYLREMGSVELLSREGEIAIAKRIEAGREAMIGGLCESPLTFQAIIIWRDELNEGEDPPSRHHRPRSDLFRAFRPHRRRRRGRGRGRVRA